MRFLNPPLWAYGVVLYFWVNRICYEVPKLNLMKLLTLLLFTFGLVGCETMDTQPSKVISNVEVFHNLKTDSNYTYNLLPFKEQEGKVEFETYSEKIKAFLNSKGFNEAPIEKADIVVFMGYGIDDGKEVISSYPIWGQTGVASSRTYGSVNTVGNTGYYSGTTYNTPSFGVVGSSTSSETVYKRFLKLEMIDNKSYLETQKRKNVFEAKVTSVGSNNSLPLIMPYMMQSLFEDFPGKSGTTREVAIPMK